MRRRKIVLIEWDDTSVIHGWFSPTDISGGIAHCQSVGFWVKEDEESITISFAVSDQDLVMEKKTIARGCIKSIKEMRVK